VDHALEGGIVSRYALALCLATALLAGCTTPPPTYRDNWRGTFAVEAELAEAAERAAAEWNRAAGDRIEWRVVSTEDELTQFADWTLTTVAEAPPDAPSDWRGRAGGSAAIVLAGLSVEKQFMVLMHELGHVAGLDHVADTTMCESLRCMPDHVDEATVAALDGVP
jgi:hypothetical protein